MKRRRGKLWIGLGIVLIVAAIVLSAYNLYESRRAKESVERNLQKLEAEMLETSAEEEQPEYMRNPEMEMPVKRIHGIDYIGVLELPTLGLKLPVISEWSYPHLRIAPCRYQGSVYADNLILAAHNYATHFGGLKTLHQGDEVRFTDVDEHTFVYEVAGIETLQPTAVEEMEDGGWDLTLFTCTIGGRSRVTVRCERIIEP